MIFQPKMVPRAKVSHVSCLRIHARRNSWYFTRYIVLQWSISFITFILFLFIVSYLACNHKTSNVLSGFNKSWFCRDTVFHETRTAWKHTSLHVSTPGWTCGYCQCIRGNYQLKLITQNNQHNKLIIIK